MEDVTEVFGGDNSATVPPEKPKRTRKKKADVSAEAAVVPVSLGVKAKPVAGSTTLTVETAVVAAPRKKKYINNGDLMIQIAISRSQDKMTDELAKMLFMLVQRYAKHPDYTNIHSYKMDMEAFANLTICKVWKGFNPEKGNNPFAYFTQVIRHAFYQYLNHEKKQRETKDILRVDMGQDPSFAYMENYREERDADYDGLFEESEDDETETRLRRPGYDATLPGEVTEINYSFSRADELPPQDNGDIHEI
jgi:DNA-directed RNA polymerase specialized sigma24 family protein